MPATALKLVETPAQPTTPRRLPNSAYRTREYLTSIEVEQLLAAVNRYPLRDAT